MIPNHTVTKIQIVLFVLLNIVIVAVGTVGGFYVYDGYREKQQIEQSISSGAQSPSALPVTVDYGKQISTGSPLTFGGAHYPPIDQDDAWDKVAQTGVTSIRVDLSLELLYPKNESVNETERNLKTQIFQRAKKRGLKVIGIMDYAPKWLTYTGTVYGVPENWTTYEKLVKQTYDMYRDYLDYVEIWNEPNLPNDKIFLIPNGSGLSRIQAYTQIYTHAATTIRDTDTEHNDGKKTPIGVQASFTADDATYLEPLLRNAKTKELVDFVSYHQYERTPSNSITAFREMTKKYEVPNLPIFITEWSASSKGSEIGDIIPKSTGITYAASMLMNYFTMGVAGANYHTITALASHKPFGIERNHAFYTFEGNRAELLPLAKSWMLLSKTMGLGSGTSKILESSVAKDSGLQTLAFINASGDKGMTIINTSDTPQLVEIKYMYPGTAPWTRTNVYEINEHTDVPKLIGKEVLEPVKNSASLKMYVSPASVTGILLKHDVSFPEQLRYQILYR